MSKEKYNSFLLSFNDLQRKIKNFKHKKYGIDQKIQTYVKNFQDIEFEINMSLIAVKDIYHKKQDYWKHRIKNLRSQRTHSKHLLEDLIKEKNNLKKPIINKEISKKIKSNKLVIKQIKSEIEKLERKIKIEALDINEEIKTVEEISELERRKQKKIEEIMEKEQIIQLENRCYFTINQRINFARIILKHNSEQLKKFTNKRRDSRNKVFDLYMGAEELSKKNRIMKQELVKSLTGANHYHESLIRELNQKWKSPAKKETKKKLKQLEKLEVKPEVRNSWFLLQKHKKEKLALALEKQKLGKKLDFYEFKLILEESKK